MNDTEDGEIDNDEETAGIVQKMIVTGSST
jgi:hypothetical protein